MSGPYQNTLIRSENHNEILLISDTTLIDLTSHSKTKGIGYVGDGNGLGFYAHNIIAYSFCKKESLGIIEQYIWNRKKLKHSDQVSSYDKKKDENRESLRWLNSLEKAVNQYQEHFEEKKQPKLISVGDCESDNFLYFREHNELNINFVLRVYINRKLIVTEEADKEEAPEYLKEAAEQAPILASKEIELKAQGKRKARTAKLEIRATKIKIDRPHWLRKKGEEGLEANLIYVKEIETKEKAIKWYLLTNEPIETEENVLKIVSIYQKRWVIEEFHMALKTGCKLEERQLESEKAMENITAVLSPIALELVRLRDIERNAEESKAIKIIDENKIRILEMITKEKRINPRINKESTIKEIIRAIAALGGFIGSKKANPGWRTLWKGYQTLLQLEQGFLLGLRTVMGFSLGIPKKTVSI